MLFLAFVVIKSLFFKLTGSPETDCICQGKLDLCAASLGLTAVGVPDGNFAAKVVDTFELIASMLLLARAAISDSRAAQVLDAAIGLGVISGATCLHLFTPRGVVVVNTDGDQRFMLARGPWPVARGPWRVGALRAPAWDAAWRRAGLASAVDEPLTGQPALGVPWPDVPGQGV